jgi:hypothetical protein
MEGPENNIYGSQSSQLILARRKSDFCLTYSELGDFAQSNTSFPAPEGHFPSTSNNLAPVACHRGSIFLFYFDEQAYKPRRMTSVLFEVHESTLETCRLC